MEVALNRPLAASNERPQSLADDGFRQHQQFENPVSWHHDDWSTRRFAIADDVTFWPQSSSPVEQRSSEVIVQVAEGEAHYEIGWAEYCVLSMMDGEHTIAEACAASAKQLGHDALCYDASIQLVRWAGQVGLFADLARPAESSLSTPLSVRIPVPGLSNFITSIADHLTWLFAPTAIVVGSLYLVLTALWMAAEWGSWIERSSRVFYGHAWLYLLLTWSVLKIIHELGHAVACRRYGCPLGKCGVAWLMLTPVAFVDVSSTWRLSSRRQRVLVSAAGMMSEWVVAATAAWTVTLSQSPVVEAIGTQVILIAGAGSLLVNGNFLMRFDGYYIVADLLGIRNLYQRSQRSLRQFSKRILLGERSLHCSHNDPLTRTSYGSVLTYSYATATLAWQIAVIAGATYASKSYLGRWSLLLGVVVAGLWWSSALRTWSQAIVTTRLERPIAALRAGSILTAVAALAAISWHVSTTMKQRSVVAIVVPRSSSELVSPVDATIAAVHVQPGQWVDAGDRLVTLENSELQQKLAEVQQQLRVNQLQHRTTTIGQSWISQKVHSGERERLEAEKRRIEQQLKRLQVVASNSGTVQTDDLRARIGCQIEQGFKLATIHSGDAIEVVGYCEDSGVADRFALADRVEFITRTGQRFPLEVFAIEPQWVQRPSEPSLYTHRGGPLAAITTRDDLSPKLVQPHRRVRFRIANADAFPPAGMIGKALIR